MPTATAPKTFTLVAVKPLGHFSTEFTPLADGRVMVCEYRDEPGRGWVLRGVPQRLPRWQAQERYSDLRKRGYSPF